MVKYNKKEESIDFYLTTDRTKIFKIKLFDYFGVKKIIFEKKNLTENFINKLKENQNKEYPSLSRFLNELVELRLDDEINKVKENN
jgi:hypothetical protein